MCHTVVEQTRPSGTLATVQISRRAVLLAAVLSVAACGKRPNPVVPPQAVNPDAAAIATAQDIERELLATYGDKIANASARERPALEVANAVHAAHLAALHGSTSTTSVITARTHLRRALKKSAVTLRGLSLAAVDGANAALFASIAASHETSAQ
jgi:predicted small lipoprotein YifL